MPTDLTMEVSPSLPAFPGSPPPAFVQWASIPEDGYGLELLMMSSHTGTHVDAPSHFVRGGRHIGAVPASRLVREAALIPARPGPRGAVPARAVLRFEARHGRLRPATAAVFRTGWSSPARLRRPASYFSSCPGISPAAARLLASRGVDMVGIDSPSIDPGPSRSFPAHRALAAAGALVVENLARLGSVRGPRFRLAVMPLRLRGATGSPARAVAL